MNTYRVTYNGYGTNNVIYRAQELEFNIRHDWSRNDEEAANVMLLIHKKLKVNFSRVEILSVEKIK